MNIKDTINTMESKLQQIDALFDASMEAENAGERFKAHGIAKDAEKIAQELEKLVDEMDCSDLDELLQEEAEIEDTVAFLVDKTNELNNLVMEYAEASREKNEVELRSKLKKIRKLGIELSHMAGRE